MKVDIIRSFLASHRPELPPTSEGLRKHIEGVARDLNFKITGKEFQTLLEEFAPEDKKKPKRGLKTDGATEAPVEPE